MNEREIEKQLKVLVNRRRLAILKYLKKNREANVSRIAGVINLSFKATSRHLNALAALDVVEREQRSLQMFYYISKSNSSVVKHILSLL